MPTIVDDQPIRELAEDRLSFEFHARALADYIQKLKIPSALAVFGEFGTGKTTFLNMVGAVLPREKFLLVFIPAFHLSRGPDEAAIVERICREIGQNSGVVRECVTTLVGAIKGILRRAALSKVSFAGVELDPSGEGTQRRVSPSLVEAEKSIVKLAEELGRKVLICVDDADRCEPPTACLEVIETLKLLLSPEAQNCLFLYALDRRMIESVVRAKYTTLGVPCDGPAIQRYLDKWIEMSVPVPLPTAQDVESLLADIGKKADVQLDDNEVRLLVALLPYNPRRIKRVCKAYLHVLGKVRTAQSNHATHLPGAKDFAEAWHWVDRLLPRGRELLLKCLILQECSFALSQAAHDSPELIVQLQALARSAVTPSLDTILFDNPNSIPSVRSATVNPSRERGGAVERWGIDTTEFLANRDLCRLFACPPFFDDAATVRKLDSILSGRPVEGNT